MNRGQAKTTDNSEYLAFVRQNYLNRLKDNLPKTVLDKTTWLPPPAVLTEVQQLLIFIQYKPLFHFNFAYLLFPDVRDSAEASLPSDGAEICEGNRTPEKGAGSTRVNKNSLWVLFLSLIFRIVLPSASA